MTSGVIKYQNEYAIKEGILLVEAIKARNAPDEDYSAAFKLHEGMKFKIKEERHGWYHIILPNGYTGWIKKEAAGII